MKVRKPKVRTYLAVRPISGAGRHLDKRMKRKRTRANQLRDALLN